jgi:hypothetical protein
MVGGQPAQLAIDDGKETLRRLLHSGVPGREKPRDLSSRRLPLLPIHTITRKRPARSYTRLAIYPAK